MWYSKVPDVNNLHIFGSEVYAHIPKECRRKLDEKAEKLRFVGYSGESKALRLLDTTTSKIVISRDVVFLEELKTSKVEEIVFEENPRQLSITNDEENNAIKDNEVNEDETATGDIK